MKKNYFFLLPAFLLCYSADARMLSKETDPGNNENALNIYVKDFPSGFYSILIKSKNQIYHSNFIKTN